MGGENILIEQENIPTKSRESEWIGRGRKERREQRMKEVYQNFINEKFKEAKRKLIRGEN